MQVPPPIQLSPIPRHQTTNDTDPRLPRRSPAGVPQPAALPRPSSPPLGQLRALPAARPPHTLGRGEGDGRDRPVSSYSYPAPLHAVARMHVLHLYPEPDGDRRPSKVPTRYGTPHHTCLPFPCAAGTAMWPSRVACVCRSIPASFVAALNSMDEVGTRVYVFVVVGGEEVGTR